MSLSLESGKRPQTLNPGPKQNTMPLHSEHTKDNHSVHKIRVKMLKEPQKETQFDSRIGANSATDTKNSHHSWGKLSSLIP